MSTAINNEIKEGLGAGIPIGMGYFAVSFAFGIMAKQGGLSAFQALILSVTNVTSAGQFAGLEVIVAGGTLFEIALTQLIINLRYLLMSCALSQKLTEGTGILRRMLMAYTVTDEVFAVSVLRKTSITLSYFLAVSFPAVVGWGGGTFIGALAGNVLPDRVVSALGLALYGMFLAIIIPPAKKSRPIALVIIVTMLISYLFTIIPVIKNISGGFKIIILTVLISGAAAIIFPVEEEASDV